MFAQIKKYIHNYGMACETTRFADGFMLRGKLLHWVAFILPLSWLMYGILILFEGGFLIWLLIGLSSGLLCVFLLSFFWFEIKITKKETIVRYKWAFVSFKVIRSATKAVVIRHKDASGLSLITNDKRIYSEKYKNNLKFQYIMPLDSDSDFFYIDYKNKEQDFSIACDEMLWTQLMKELHHLDKS